MQKDEKRPTQQQILLYSLFFALAMLFFSIVLPRMLASRLANPGLLPENPSHSSDPISTNAPPTQNVEAQNTPLFEPATLPTQQIFMPPIVGTSDVNLPFGFKVKKWRDNSCDYSLFSNKVEIYGVEIYGGTSPYRFNFMSIDGELEDFEVSSNSEYVKFPDPVQIKRGEYIQVTITFQFNNGISQWIDHIIYLDKSLCLED